MESELPPLLSPEPKTRATALRLLHHQDFGPIERIVRALMGLPLMAAFLYFRHFNFGFSILVLMLGSYLVFTSAFHYCAIRHLLYWMRWKAFR